MAQGPRFRETDRLAIHRLHGDMPLSRSIVLKYLVIDTRDGGDWSLDLMFAGLVKLLGPENVIDYPRKEKHREWNPSASNWGMERRTLGYTDKNYLVSSSIDEIWNAARSRELTVITDERQESMMQYAKLGLLHYRVPVIIVAGHDEFWNPGGPAAVREFYQGLVLHMFVDNVTGDLDRGTSLINLSANFEHYWPYRPVEKSVDICFFGSTSHPDRARVIEYISNHPQWSQMKLDIVLEGRPGVIDTFIPKSEYFERMARSRVCLNIGGAACGRAFRFYEIPWSGSFMLSQAFPARQLHPFVSGIHCGYFHDQDSLDAWLACTLLAKDCDEFRETIANKGRQHLIKYHTCTERVRYVLDTVSADKSWSDRQYMREHGS